VHRRYVLVGGPAGGPTDTVIHSTNSLGFRGPEPPADGIDHHLSIIAVGGSTTECYYLPDGSTWPERLQTMLAPSFPDVWINNGGLDGHSTYGHLILMRDYVGKLKPRVVLSSRRPMTSARWGSPTTSWPQVRSGIRGESLEALVKSAAAYSEVADVALNLYRSWRAPGDGRGAPENGPPA